MSKEKQTSTKPKKGNDFIADVVGRSEQIVCDCGNSSMTWYGNDDDKKWFCFNCKKEAK